MKPNEGFDPWFLVAAFLLVIAVIAGAHVLLPRREFLPVDNGHALIQCDRWTGRCQRVEWSTTGKITLGDVYTSP